jgi:anti-anti-sigma factor
MRKDMLDIQDAHDGVVRLEGEIDAATAPALLRRLEAEPVVRVLDMERVTFLDSSGLKVLTIANRSRDSDGPLMLRAPSASVRRLLDIAGLADTFGIADQATGSAD